MKRTIEPSEFHGFPPAALEFMAELERNNSRAWFEAHREDYEESVILPARAFIEALGERMIELVDGILYDTRTSGSGSLMKIHRDVRFSRDKTPYHTHIRVLFWHVEGHRTSGPGFYMGFNHQGGALYAGQWQFRKHELEEYRRCVLDDELGNELADAIRSLESTESYEVKGLRYKRVPAGYPADHVRAHLLRFGGLYAQTDDLAAEDVIRPGFVEHCLGHFRNMAHIVVWLAKIYGWETT